MTTSGTVGQTVIDVATLIDHAFRRAGLSPAVQTEDNLQAAKNNLYFYLSGLSNAGVNLWTIQKIVLGTLNNQVNYSIGVGTVDIQNANYRTLTLASGGTATSSAGGDADNAFDDDLDTVCTQTSAAGNISYEFTEETAVANVTFMPNGDQTYTLVWEALIDGSWVEVLSKPKQDYTDKTWYCYDIDFPRDAEQFRVRETGNGILDVRSLGFNTILTEIPMTRLSLDIYSSLVNKTFTSRNVLQYWLNRKADNPEAVIWPISNYDFDQLVFWRTTQIQDVGSLTNTLDIPQRWIDPVVDALALRLIMEIPNADMSRYPILKERAAESYDWANAEERDKSGIFISPNISPYTR